MSGSRGCDRWEYCGWGREGWALVQERAFWVAWSRVEGVGPILLAHLKEHFGDLSLAWDASAAELAEVSGFGDYSAGMIANQRSQIDPEALLHQHEQDNPHFWTPADADYPKPLLEIPDLPPVLYYRGSPEAIARFNSPPAIAMVGTRSPSDYGKRWTRKISMALTKAGFTIVSGLAAGVDTEAHRSCVEAGGCTLAVMGTGVDVIYPSFNDRLASQIVARGLLLSEYPAGTQPDRAHFPRRNRIIAGLSRATLVIEAPQKSGALISARLANDYGRDVYALPGSLDNPKALGCLELLNRGAQMILGVEALLELLGEIPQLQPDPVQLPLFDLPPELAQVLNVIQPEPASVDWIVQQADRPTGEVLSALAQLELMSLVTQLPGMRYQRG